VRYLFNRIELSNPFADNIKPAYRFLGWYTIHHPIQAFRFLRRDGLEMWRRIRKKWHHPDKLDYRARASNHQASLERLAQGLARREGFDRESNWTSRLRDLDDLKVAPWLSQRSPSLRLLVRLLLNSYVVSIAATLQLLAVGLGALLILLPLLEPAVPEVIQAAVTDWYSIAPSWVHTLVEICRWVLLVEILILVCLLLWLSRRSRSRLSPRTILREKAAAIQRILQPSLIILGHTHDTDFQILPGGCEYYNTGTWTKVFSPEERLIREEKELTFVRVLEGPSGLRAKLLKWEEHRRKARLVHLYDQ
jgi:hypothetical protein